MSETDLASGYSIIIPAFEEEDFIANTLSRLCDYLKRDAQIWDETEVIVVVANSSDKTAELARINGHFFKHFKLIEPGPKLGKGRDVKSGMLAAQGKYRLFMDADLATPLHHIVPAFKELDEGFDVVMGERNLWKVHKLFHRRIMSAVGNRVVRTLLGLKYGDTQCGFKAFTAQASEDLFSRQTIMGWGFDIEILAIARERGLKVKRHYVEDWHDPKDKTGLVGESAWKAALKTLTEAWDIRRKWKRGAYR